MGKVKCKRCEGEGKYTDYSDDVQAMYFKRCERCGGAGYIEEEVVGETTSYSSGQVADVLDALCDALEEREREVERLSKRLEDCENLSADRRSAHIRTLHTIYAMYGRMEEVQAEVERLRDALQDIYEAAHTTWQNDEMEAAVKHVREALAASEVGREEE